MVRIHVLFVISSTRGKVPKEIRPKAAHAETRSHLHKTCDSLALPFISFDYANSNFHISEVGQSPPVPPPRSILS